MWCFRTPGSWDYQRASNGSSLMSDDTGQCSLQLLEQGRAVVWESAV